ncbi:MAG: alkaline phosphatase [Flavobacteriaceae bacterium]|nr:alkaline phosphatase [Flavobacteriaceae bacterium]
MKKINLFFALTAFLIVSLNAQDYKVKGNADSLATYHGNKEIYAIKNYDDHFSNEKPTNVILMIGDGMGTAQIYAGKTANKGALFLDNFKKTGFVSTYSSEDYVTDSAAGGTAMACGVKTYNAAIGVDNNKKPVKSILEKVAEKKLGTGLVSTSAITHATPAAFIAHQPHRNMYEEIAADFLKTNIDVFIGGGYDHFTKRKDGRNLANELAQKGYSVIQDINQIKDFKVGKLAGLTAPEHNERVGLRKNMLETATQTALNLLSQKKNGFFLMVEGSQIDWGGHANDITYIVEEMLDFDKAIGVVLEFAAKHKNTLVIVTADHETGGLTLNKGDLIEGTLIAKFTTGSHTGVMVPIFAFGPGAEHFTGIIDNTDIPKKIEKLMNL